jgi:hypothetical protein
VNPVLILGGVLFIIALVSKPELIAVFFFTVTIADINFEAGPLNMRALVGLALFARTLISKPSENQPGFFSIGGIQQIFTFLAYTVLITSLYDLWGDRFMKSTFLTIISVYCGYYYFFKKGNTDVLKSALIISGIICFSDLAYTYVTAGEFPVQRIFMVLMKMPHEVDETGKLAELYNHNFFGLVCGMTFIFLLNEFIADRLKNKLLLIMMPLMALGVLMSTSRSSLLAMIVISLFLMVRELKDKSKAKKVYRVFGLLMFAVFLALFVFTFAQDYLHLSSEFIDNVTNRLVDEPIQVLNKNLGKNYKAENLDALDWREVASTVAYERFMAYSFVEQLFGIGTGGFLARGGGHLGLNPHNGPLLLVIESGIMGLVFYFFMLVSAVRKSFTRPVVSSCALVTIFMIIYCLGQNEELTNSSTLLFVTTLISENKKLAMEEKAAEEQDPPSEIPEFSYDYPE